MDYYKILNLDKSCTSDMIKSAYRKLALKYHPDKNQTVEAQENFILIAEAYDVLNDPQKRAVYDNYGYDGLKRGVPGREGYEGYHGGYCFHKDANKIFYDFFGGDNPFSDFFIPDKGDKWNTENIDENEKDINENGIEKVMFGRKFGGLHGMKKTMDGIMKIKKNPPLEKELEITLEQLYNGAIKCVKIERKILNEDGMTTSVETKKLTINIKKGYKEGTRIIFPNLGDQSPDTFPADIVFILKEKPHEIFKRKGNDLYYHVNISLLKALTGTVVEIKTLDNRLLRVPVNEIICPNYKKEVPNEGMPISKTPNKKGSLFITFTLEFPTYFSENQKSLIKQAFENKPNKAQTAQE